MDDELGYPDGIYQNIFITTLFVHPIHIFAGFYYDMPLCGIMGITLYGTSLNYWKYPRMGSKRRTIDMIVAKSSILYHLYLSLYTSNKLLTFIPIFFGSSFYFCSIYLHKKSYIKYAATLHCLLHLFVSIGACFTYRDYYLN